MHSRRVLTLPAHFPGVGSALRRSRRHLDSSLGVISDSAPGEIVAQLEAVFGEPTAGSRVTLPWKDPKQTPNGGPHPWQVTPRYSSALTLFNDDESLPASATMSFYSEGPVWMKQIVIAPLSTADFSIGEIIAKQLPDDKGRKLPQSSSHGIVDWYTMIAPHAFGMLVQVDSSSQVARPYACL